MTTDYVNGANLINNGDTIWGVILMTLPFVPMASVGLLVLLYITFDGDNRFTRSYRLLAVVLFIPGVILSTALYVLFVLTAGFVKVLNPEIESQPDRDVFLGIDGDDIAKLTPLLRMGEVVGESYPQAAIGNFLIYITMKLGPIHFCHIYMKESTSSYMLAWQRIQPPRSSRGWE